MRQIRLSAAATKPAQSRFRAAIPSHRFAKRHGTWPTVSAIVLLAASGPFAMAQSPPNGQAPVARPQAEAMRVEELSPEMEQILTAWEKSTGQIKSLQGKHKRITYNSVFNTEAWASGVFYYEAPDRGRIDVVPVEIPEGARSRKTNPENGEPYKLQPDRPERWVCDGTTIVQISDEAKEYLAFPVPKDLQGVNIINGPLPFLFGMPPEVAKQRFELSLAGQNETSLYLRAIPRRKADAANYKEALIMLDRRRFLPTAVKLFGPDGSTETVFQFSDLEINKGRNPLLSILRLGKEKNPFQPDLKGYQPVQVAQPDDSGSDRPSAPRTATPPGNFPRR